MEVFSVDISCPKKTFKLYRTIHIYAFMYNIEVTPDGFTYAEMQVVEQSISELLSRIHDIIHSKSGSENIYTIDRKLLENTYVLCWEVKNVDKAFIDVTKQERFRLTSPPEWVHLSFRFEEVFSWR